METFFWPLLRKVQRKTIVLKQFETGRFYTVQPQGPFLKRNHKYWTKFNYKDDNLDFASTCIWYNSHIRIENRPFFYRSWLSAGIKEIRDLLDNDQNFLSYNAFIDKYSIKTNYLEYHKVISAVAHYKKVHSTAYHDPTPKDPVDTLLSHTKVSKKIYECLINEEASIPSRSQGKWLEESSKLGKYVRFTLIYVCSNLNSFTEKTPQMTFCTK